MKKRLRLVSLSTLSLVAMPILTVACGANDAAEGDKLKDIAVAQKEWLGGLMKKLDSEETLTNINALTIFGDYGINVDATGGTSSSGEGKLGDKYGDFGRFVTAYEKLSDDEKSELTFESFGMLFQDAGNEKFHIGSMAKIILTRAFIKKHPEYGEGDKPDDGGGDEKPPVTETEIDEEVPAGTPVAKPKTQEDHFVWDKAGALAYNDEYWTVKSNSYTEDVKLGRGKTYYQDLTKAGGNYPQFDLDQWMHVFDNNAAKMTEDPKHIYASTAPKNYSASADVYAGIYETAYSDLVKTGNNNNGFNGIYSGAGFKLPSKEFDISKVETLALGKVYDPSQTPFDTTKRISNGWEHVSPQSKEKAVLGEKGEKIGRAIGDLHNLRPSIQDAFNGPRSNNMFGMVSGDSNTYGVDFEIGKSMFDPNMTVVEPRVNVRGDIARMTFYMHDRYHVTYDEGYYKMMSLWAAMDPVTDEEKALDAKIAAKMGFHNEYVTGEKQIPYSADVAAQVRQAITDRAEDKNTHSWGIPDAIVFQNEIITEDDAKALDWTNARDVTPGVRPDSVDGGALNVGKLKQAIIKITMEANGAVYYVKVTVLQSKAILVAALEGHDATIKDAIKIATNHDGATDPKTFLLGNTTSSYASMVDKISEIKYLIVD